MLAIRAVCRGLHVGRLYVPPFEVQGGEFVCLHIPGERIDQMALLDEVLGGQRSDPSWQVTGSLARVKRPMPRPGFLWRSYNPKVIDWLTGSAGVPLTQAVHILLRWRIPFHQRIGHLSANLRLWLALQAAFARKADVMVFETVGSGPDGIQTAYDLITPELSRCAVIHLSQPTSLGRICFPGAKCIALRTEENPTWTAA